MPEGDQEQLGPIEFLAVEFPDGQPGGEGFDVLLDLALRDVIRILDVEFVAKDADGNASLVTTDAIPGLDLSAWEGASSGLLDAADIEQVTANMAAGGIAVVVVFESRWVTRLVDAWRARGARLIAEGGIPASDLIDALDATESD
jgi:Family of unknown function (DUF6325)